jgi:hypothetical protein
MASRNPRNILVAYPLGWKQAHRKLEHINDFVAIEATLLFEA